MATRRSSRREQTSNPRPQAKGGFLSSDDDSERGRRRSARDKKAELDTSTDSEQPSSSKHDDGDTDSSYTSGMLLDVLAQVATDRLGSADNDQETVSDPPKKLSKRVLAAMDVLNIEHITQLSDKLLVSLFTELTSDEIARNYTYTCFLMGPDVCRKTYSSFGNEARAKSQILTHLQAHVSELLSKQRDEANFKFYAETAHARRKRLEGEKALLRRSRARNKVLAREKLKYTKMRSGNMRNVSPPDLVNTDVDSSSSNKRRDFVVRPGRKKRQEQIAINYEDELILAAKVEEEVVEEMNVDSDLPLAQNEQRITEMLRRTQPFLDHTYTSVFGPQWNPPRPQDHMYTGEDAEAMGGSKCTNSARTAGLLSLNCEGGRAGTHHSNSTNVPLIREPGEWPSQLHSVSTNRLSISDAVESIVKAEEVVNTEEVKQERAEEEVISLIDGRTRKGLYPPMPKSELAQRGRIHVPEELAEEEDERAAQSIANASNSTNTNQGFVGRRRKSVNVSVTTDYERKLALKCIRELRLRKREDAPLVCKICENNKSFTATATLLYHYRSHAGIKPFVCLICNTTFTRQHSLNYHMLIHNNQSRFTCKDCGRKFRHPSHFKEHMRRHTGETPFHCMDCPLRFKTRNTYKRHLRTRHLKLLTAAGIRRLNKQTMMAENEDAEDDEEEDEEEDVCEDEEYDYEDDVEEETVGALEEGVSVTVEELASSSSPPPQPLATLLTNLPPENTASNKLLQFCSQVVSQEAG